MTNQGHQVPSGMGDCREKGSIREYKAAAALGNTKLLHPAWKGKEKVPCSFCKKLKLYKVLGVSVTCLVLGEY